MATVIRGTTPTITCNVTDDGGQAIDLTGYTLFFSIGKPTRPQLTVTNDQMTISGGTVAVTLTQEQTLALNAGETLMQLRMVDGTTALATLMKQVTIAPIIYNGEIEDVVE